MNNGVLNFFYFVAYNDSYLSSDWHYTVSDSSHRVSQEVCRVQYPNI
jgi:hypothetical protein